MTLIARRGRAGCIAIEPLANDPRPATAILDRLDPPQDQLGIGLADRQGSHSLPIGREFIKVKMCRRMLP